MIKPERFFIFLELTALGFHISASAGDSIRGVLSRNAGIPSDYLDAVVQTVFHNGRAVDDDRSAVVQKDSRIALSAAMPGLVGAVFRKNSPVAALRTLKSQDSAPSPGAGAEITVTLKLFNRVNADLGPFFLKQGIRISGEAAREFFLHHRDLLEEACEQAWMDDLPADVEGIINAGWQEEIRLIAAAA